MKGARDVRTGRTTALAAALAATLAMAAPAPAAAQDRTAATQRREGEALLAIADAALHGRGAPEDLRLAWHNDFLKAQQGTFVPFTLTIEASPALAASALLYVRAVPRPARDGDDARQPPVVDAIVPVEARMDGRGRAVVTRGFSVPAGDYDVCIVVRERLDPANPKATPRAGAMVVPVTVPDFWTGQLSASTVMLGRRLVLLDEAPSADGLSARPYAIGRNELTPAADGRFRAGEELIVVVLVYDPAVSGGRQFDVEVEYHFFRKAGAGDGAQAPDFPLALPGEAYFNHTEPQRFTPDSMGRAFDPAQPVMAGQGIPLAGFAPGEYRLAVLVTDKVSGRRVSRDASFAVVPPR